ncbi:hypothetical protein [Natrarchaeobius oligotrophus]|uniref:Uncharacterized protein n=1 Tax=Natrarchaeobius chitinivorans TaxID=1679083 RepID=A0A3N6MK88_NATCH|nr:hypothetical protein [Natrarchaeobius chitinivorans]RQH01765.1 hypothetical protein EA472_05435 [Natrarchaeobius chitinivorans]
MTDDDRISRRASLKGIAATGALIGGSALGVSSASAGEKKEKKDHGKDKKDHGKYKKGKKGKKKKDHGKEKDCKKEKKKERRRRKKAREVADQVAFNFECFDPETEYARFYLHHGKDTDLTFTVKVVETGATGEITVENTLASAETFWVHAPDGNATVKLYYKGYHIATAQSDPDDHCD